MIPYRPLDLLILAFVMVIWGCNIAVVKIGLQEMPPWFFMAARFALVALILAPFVKLPRERWPEILLLSVVLGLFHFTFIFLALKDLDVATTAIAIQLQVPFTALLSWLVYADKLGWWRASGMAVAFAGVVIIAGEPRLEGQLGALALIVAAAVCFAFSTIIMKRLGDLPGTAINGWMAVFATPQLIAASLLLEDNHWEQLTSLSTTSLFCIFYQSVIVVALGYGLWYRMLRRYPLNQVMPTMLTIPFIGVLAGVVFLDETMTWALLGGGFLTISGVAVIMLAAPMGEKGKR